MKDKDLLPLLVMLESIGKIRVYAQGFTDAYNFFWADDQIRFNATRYFMILLAKFNLTPPSPFWRGL
jgi:hypothetical protein